MTEQINYTICPVCGEKIKFRRQQPDMCPVCENFLPDDIEIIVYNEAVTPTKPEQSGADDTPQTPKYRPNNDSTAQPPKYRPNYDSTVRYKDQSAYRQNEPEEAPEPEEQGPDITEPEQIIVPEPQKIPEPEPEIPEPEKPPELPEPVPVQPVRRKKSRTPLIIGGITAGAILIGGISAAVIFGGQGDDVQTSDTQTEAPAVTVPKSTASASTTAVRTTTAAETEEPAADPEVTFVRDMDFTDTRGNVGLYTGEMKNDMPWGQGTFWYNTEFEEYDGSYAGEDARGSYDGEWVNGVRSGSGTETVTGAMGSVMTTKGSYGQDWIVGKGYIEWTYYDGTQITYAGEFGQGGAYNGEGLLTEKYPDGRNTTYEGGFANSVRSGSGIYTANFPRELYPMFRIYYTGEFRNNTENGAGVRTTFNSEGTVLRQEGNFLNGVPDGVMHCIFTDLDGNKTTYDEMWENGTPVS